MIFLPGTINHLTDQKIDQLKPFLRESIGKDEWVKVLKKNRNKGCEKFKMYL